MKEDIKPKDGKRKLYFTIDMQNFISYNLELKTTCRSIFETNKNLIISKLTELNNNTKIDINNYDFFFIDLKGIKKTQASLQTKIKLNWDLCISQFLQNPKTILCFLEKTEKNRNSRMKLRNNTLEGKTNMTNNEKLLKMKKKYLINKESEDFYTNKSVFLYNYDNNSYVKLKANLSEKQLTIHGKIDKIILIQDINTKTYCDKNNPMVNSLYVTSGFIPPYYMIFKTNDEQIILGLKNEEKIKKWQAGIDFVIANYKKYTTDIDFKININNLKVNISENEKNIIEDSLIYENWLKNKEKKKIFYSLFEDKKIAKLIEDIFIYQSLVEKNNFKNGIIKLYEILDMINKNNKEENQNKKSNLTEIIDQKRFYNYFQRYNKANELIQNNNNNEALKTILTSNLFDDSLFYLNQLYIVPYLKKFKDEFGKLSKTHGKSDIRKNIQSLVAFYYMNHYNLNYKDSFLDLNK